MYVKAPKSETQTYLAIIFISKHIHTSTNTIIVNSAVIYQVSKQTESIVLMSSCFYTPLFEPAHFVTFVLKTMRDFCFEVYKPEAQLNVLFTQLWTIVVRREISQFTITALFLNFKRVSHKQIVTVQGVCICLRLGKRASSISVSSLRPFLKSASASVSVWRSSS